MSGTALWAAVIAGSVGCYLLKLAGLSVPASWVQQPWVARVVDFVPAALLAALRGDIAGAARAATIVEGVTLTAWSYLLMSVRLRNRDSRPSS